MEGFVHKGRGARSSAAAHRSSRCVRSLAGCSRRGRASSRGVSVCVYRAERDAQHRLNQAQHRRNTGATQAQPGAIRGPFVRQLRSATAFRNCVPQLCSATVCGTVFTTFVRPIIPSTPATPRSFLTCFFVASCERGLAESRVLLAVDRGRIAHDVGHGAGSRLGKQRGVQAVVCLDRGDEGPSLLGGRDLSRH